jgi:adenosine 3'-phospho 5'-phosphosulfate transporter B3
LKEKKSPATMMEVQTSSPSASAAKPPWFETQNPSVQFSLLACGVCLFFGLHNLLQEAMMNIEGFKFGVMLGYMEVLG